MLCVSLVLLKDNSSQSQRCALFAKRYLLSHGAAKLMSIELTSRVKIKIQYEDEETKQKQ